MKIILSINLLFFTTSLVGQIHHIGAVSCNHTLSGFNQSMILANSPDGRFVYAVGNLGASISIYYRDAESSQLTCIEEIANHSRISFALNEVSYLIISPDGLNMYMAGSSDAEIIIFERNILTGSIEQKKTALFRTSEKLSGIDFLKFSPNGNYLYASGYHDAAIVTYKRNLKNGRLTFLEKISNDQKQQVVLSGVSSLDISPDGQFLYATAFEEAAINVFHRNEKTGRLNFIEIKLNGLEGVEGLKGAKSVKVSPDGRNVYVTGFLDSAIVIFERSNENGQLNFLEVIRDTTKGMNELLGVQQIEINPDGSELYVTTSSEDGLMVYQRDILTGSLEFDKSHQQKNQGTKNNYRPLEMSISPNGKNIYVSGLKNNEIDVFDRTYFIKQTQNVCQVDLINIGETENLVSGIYLDTLQLPNSTHIIETHLTVSTSTESQFVELCQGETFSIGGNGYSNPGIYTAFVTSDNGCDVELTLYLSKVL